MRLRLPSLNVDAPVSPVSLSSRGVLGVPDNPHVVGWWEQGAHPGAPLGSVVFDGHVDTAEAGPGAFFHLRDLRVGDPVFIETDNGVITYVVVATHSYPKPLLPSELFDPTGVPRTVLITCGGSFDWGRRSYSDNIVVEARAGT